MTAQAMLQTNEFADRLDLDGLRWVKVYAVDAELKGTLEPGEFAGIDTLDTTIPDDLSEHLFALHHKNDSDRLLIKRLMLIPHSDPPQVSISGNPYKYPLDRLVLLGRIVAKVRRF
jgi:hypothetical protein